MNFITFRRRGRSKSETKNETSESIISSDTLDGTTSSLQEISDDETEQLKRLQETITTLDLQLKSAHNEIDSLLLENNKLKHTNAELLKKNQLLITVTQSPIKYRTQSPIKSKLQQSTLKSTHSQTEFSDIQKIHNELLEKQPTSKLPKNTERRYDKIVMTNSPSASTKCPLTSDCSQIQSKAELNTKCITPQTEAQRHILNKICILSTIGQNKIIPAATNVDEIVNEYEVMHYLTTNVGVKEMLKGIDNKLSKYTKNDFCLIMIGEEDFRHTHDYNALVSFIRETIQNIENTNIIICLPTYKLTNATNLYNYRLHQFNNKLYSDNVKHEYAYIYDSNKKLAYDNTMFQSISGKINSKGLQTIFKGVFNLTKNICQHEKYLSQIKNDESMQLFHG